MELLVCIEMYWDRCILPSICSYLLLTLGHSIEMFSESRSAIADTPLHQMHRSAFEYDES